MSESRPPDIQHFIHSQVLAENQTSDYQRFRAEVQRRLKSLEDGNYIELNGDEELDQFFDELLQEVKGKQGVTRETPSMD